MKRIELLDYGRLFAAIAVLVFHYFFNGIANGKLTSLGYIDGVAGIAAYGYLGVEFFFIISGYVIFFSAHGRTAEEFCTSRALRLLPAFWFAVIFTSSVALIFGARGTSVEPLQVLANLTLMPNNLGFPFVDAVYWTLQVEIAFYTMVLLLLLFGLNRRLAQVLICWPFALLACRLAGLQELPFLGGYYAYFAAGAAFAIHKTWRTKWTLIPIVICLALCVEFSANQALLLGEKRGTAYSQLAIAFIIAAQFAFFFAINTRIGSELRLPASALAGALTYPLYLVHAHVGYMVLSWFATEGNKLWTYPLTIALVFLAAYLIHEFVERRPRKFWRKLFGNSFGRAAAVLANRFSPPPLMPSETGASS